MFTNPKTRNSRKRVTPANFLGVNVLYVGFRLVVECLLTQNAAGILKLRVKIFLVPGIWSEKRVLGPAKGVHAVSAERRNKPCFLLFDTFPKLTYNYFSSKSLNLSNWKFVSVFMYT